MTSSARERAYCSRPVWRSSAIQTSRARARRARSRASRARHAGSSTRAISTMPPRVLMKSRREIARRQLRATSSCALSWRLRRRTMRWSRSARKAVARQRRLRQSQWRTIFRTSSAAAIARAARVSETCRRATKPRKFFWIATLPCFILRASAADACCLMTFFFASSASCFAASSAALAAASASRSRRSLAVRRHAIHRIMNMTSAKPASRSRRILSTRSRIRCRRICRRRFFARAMRTPRCSTPSAHHRSVARMRATRHGSVRNHFWMRAAAPCREKLDATSRSLSSKRASRRAWRARILRTLKRLRANMPRSARWIARAASQRRPHCIASSKPARLSSTRLRHFWQSLAATSSARRSRTSRFHRASRNAVTTERARRAFSSRAWRARLSRRCASRRARRLPSSTALRPPMPRHCDCT